MIIHTANSDSTDHRPWFYDGIRSQGVTWDITGLSYYCFWHGGADEPVLGRRPTARTRYGKPVVLVETAYPFTTANADSQANSANGTCAGFDASWTGQATMFQYIQNTARNAGGDRRLLLGAHLDRRAGQRLGPGQHQRHRRRLGQHGRLQLERPRQPRHPLDPLTPLPEGSALS